MQFRSGFFVLVMAVVCLGDCHQAITAAPISPVQMPSEKESRTPAQRKIDSQVLYEIYRVRGQAKQKNVPPGPTSVRIDKAGRAFVDVRAEVTPALEKKVRSLGGTIQSTSIDIGRSRVVASRSSNVSPTIPPCAPSSRRLKRLTSRSRLFKKVLA